jgi:hypothetical protein
MHFGRNASQSGCAINCVDFYHPEGASPFPYQVRDPHMAQRAIRFSEATDRGIHEATEKRGFSSPTAFIRHAVEQELAGHAEQLVTTEHRLVAGFEQIKGGSDRAGAVSAGLIRVAGQPG